MVLCLSQWGSKRRGSGVLSPSPGLPLPVHWAGRSERWLRHAAWTEPECSWKRFKKSKQPEPRSAFFGTGSASNMEPRCRKMKKATTPHWVWISIQLLFGPCVVVMVIDGGCCCGDACILRLSETGRVILLARSDSGKGMWLVIGWFFLAFQGHRVAMASLLAYPGSGLPLQLLSLTTGEETQNWQEAWGKWTLNSLYSLSTLVEIILHFVHSDFGSASLLALIWEKFCPSSVSLP